MRTSLPSSLRIKTLFLTSQNLTLHNLRGFDIFNIIIASCFQHKSHILAGYSVHIFLNFLVQELDSPLGGFLETLDEHDKLGIAGQAPHVPH